MRIISQDGMIDIPYENIALRIDTFGCGDGTDLWHIHCCNNDYKTTGLINGILATYSSKKKAKKAMEMLRCAFCSTFTISEPIQIKTVHELFPGTGWITSIPELGNKNLDNFYFQFPNDDEVEV